MAAIISQDSVAPIDYGAQGPVQFEHWDAYFPGQPFSPDDDRVPIIHAFMRYFDALVEQLSSSDSVEWFEDVRVEPGTCLSFLMLAVCFFVGTFQSFRISPLTN